MHALVKGECHSFRSGEREQKTSFIYSYFAPKKVNEEAETQVEYWLFHLIAISWSSSLTSLHLSFYIS